MEFQLLTHNVEVSVLDLSHDQLKWQPGITHNGRQKGDRLLIFIFHVMSFHWLVSASDCNVQWIDRSRDCYVLLYTLSSLPYMYSKTDSSAQALSLLSIAYCMTLLITYVPRCSSKIHNSSYCLTERLVRLTHYSKKATTVSFILEIDSTTKSWSQTFRRYFELSIYGQEVLRTKLCQWVCLV